MMEHSQPDDYPEQNAVIPRRKKIQYAFGGFAEALLGDAVLSALFPFYNIVLKVDAVKLGAVLVAPRLYDAITDPLMGWISDNTRSRWGRRRPYIAIGCLLVALTVFLQWAPPENLGPDGLAWYLMAISILGATAMTITIVPYYGLGAELSVDYNERSRVMAYRAVATRVGAVIACLAFWFAYRPIFDGPRQGFRVIGIIGAVICIVVFWVVVLGLRERPQQNAAKGMSLWTGTKAVFKNKAFLIISSVVLLFIFGIFASFPIATYINIYYVFGGDQEKASFLVSMNGALMHLSGMLFVPLVTKFSVHYGKKKAFFIGLLSFGLVPLTSWFFYNPNYPYLQLIYIFLLGIGLSSFLVFPYSMIADVCDLDELATGQRREGAYSGFFSFLFKFGFSFTSLINAYCLRLTGFDQNLAVQSPSTIFNLRLILMLLPSIVIVGAAFLLLLYPLSSKRVSEIRHILEERRLAGACENQASPS